MICRHTNKIVIIVLFMFSNIISSTYSQSKTKLQFLGNNNNYPFEFLNSQGKPDGFTIDLIKAIGKTMNFDVEVHLEPWKQTIDEIFYGSNFNISAMFYSEGREQMVDYSAPILFSENEIFVPNGNKNINSIADLMDKKVAVEEGSYTEEYLLRTLPEVDLLHAVSIPDALELLSQGKCDAAIVERLAGDRSITRFGIKNLKKAVYPIIPGEYGFVIAKNDSALLSNINLGLAVLKKNGTYASLFNKWIIQTAPKTVTVQTIVSWSIIILAIIIFITGIILLWIHSLKRLVNIRTKELRHEVEEHIKTEHELKIQKEKAEESNRLKSEFLAQMSHEIRTPLNVILGYINLIEMDIKEFVRDDINDLFDGIKDASYRLMRTVTSILDMSALKTRKYEADYEIVNINEILDSLYHNFFNLAKNKNLSFQLYHDLGTILVKADYYTTVKLFENIIDNAVKYTKEGSVTINILKAFNEDINIQIKDTGIGISEDYLLNIFEPFTQESTGNSRRFEGSGLGLSLVKEYAGINNFDVKIDSKKGTGTVVSVLIHPISRN